MAELLALQSAVDTAAHQAYARRVVIRGDRLAVRHLLGSAHTAIARLNSLRSNPCPQPAGLDAVRIEWVPRHRNATPTVSRGPGLPDSPAVSPLILALSCRRRR